VLDLAFAHKEDIKKERKQEDEERSKHRRERMLQAHARREPIEQRVQKEKDKLSKLHLITSAKELHDVIQDIGDK